MAYTFSNGIITGDNGERYDLNSAYTGGGYAGALGALNKFYDQYAINRGGATMQPSGFAQYSPSYTGTGGANQASQIGMQLLPQIQEWYNSRQPAAQANALAPASQPAAPPAASTPPKEPPRQTASAPPANPWATQPKPGAGVVPPLPGDPAGVPGYQPPTNALAQPSLTQPTVGGAGSGWPEGYGPREQYTAEQQAAIMKLGPLFRPKDSIGDSGFSSRNDSFPALPAGFNLRTGSTDPNDPTGQNQAVYGTNYFPGGLPGFEGITNAQQFAALTPEQQGSYREALYLYNMRQQGYGPQPGGVVPPLPGDPAGLPGYVPGQPNQTTGGSQIPTPGGGGGGGTGSTQPYQNPPSGSVGPSPSGPPGFGGGTDQSNSGFPFPGAYTAPPFSYSNVQDFTQNPAYQARLKESERALNRQLLNTGRSDSTGGQNAFATNARRLGAEFEQEAYNRAKGENVLNYDRFLGENMTAYDRALTINKLTYDRKYQEDVLNYEREYRENERKYGRDMAENILAYERAFREDAREYERVRYLYQTGAIGSLPTSGA